MPGPQRCHRTAVLVKIWSQARLNFAPFGTAPANNGRGPCRAFRPGLDCSSISRILSPLSRLAIIYLTRSHACPARTDPGATITRGFLPLSRKSERATHSSALSCTAWGLSCDPACARIRWALTPPFHPYPSEEVVSCQLSVKSHRKFAAYRPIRAVEPRNYL
jgi:hypothetical protein